MRPIVLLTYILTFTSGLIDSVTVLGLGNIFASLMTGNFVFIGLRLGGAQDFSVLRSGLAILAFAVGAAVGGRLAKSLKGGPLRRWLLPTAVIEAVLMAVAAGIAHVYIGSMAEDELAPSVLMVIALTSLAMGVRTTTITRLALPDLKTTVMTLTLTGLAADSRFGGHKSQNAVRRLASVLLLVSGAAVGALLLLAFGIAVPLILMAATVLLATAVYSLTEEASRPRDELAGE
jgi:uncharacterized membrane protein YoaK (UPF0700 family)